MTSIDICAYEERLLRINVGASFVTAMNRSLCSRLFKSVEVTIKLSREQDIIQAQRQNSANLSVRVMSSRWNLSQRNFITK